MSPWFHMDTLVLLIFEFTASGRGKTHTLFGTDSSYNETNVENNILTTVYKEVKKHIPNMGVSLNFIEIGYNEQDQSEHVIDLLDFSCILNFSA
jgi:hypothetical protein